VSRATNATLFLFNSTFSKAIIHRHTKDDLAFLFLHTNQTFF
jgi:hypothetical protein